MEKKRISLVLEGGGFRGAYTAGCLSWLIDEGLDFDCSYGISTGAVHLCSYLLKNKEYLYELSTKYIADKRFVGLLSLLKEGRIVSYDYFFDVLLKEQLKYDMSPLKQSSDGKIGVYNLNEGKTEYYHCKDIDLNYLKAACSLPILGKIVKTDGKQLLDGGITEMIPVEEAMRDGMEKFLVITTKPGDYVRKPAKGFVVWLMKVLYPMCPRISKDYKIRHKNYNDQVALIKKLESEGKAVYMYPSKTVKVSRLKGDEETLRYLYELGRQDMENQKERIYALFK